MRLKLETFDAGARALVDDVTRRFSDKEIRDSLMPAARIVRDSVRTGAPVGPTGRTKKSIKTKKFQSGPAVAVVIDRKLAKNPWPSNPQKNPYSYVGRTIYRQNEKKGTNYWDEGVDAALPEAGNRAVAELKKLAKIRGLL